MSPTNTPYVLSLTNKQINIKKRIFENCICFTEIIESSSVYKKLIVDHLSYNRK